MEFQFKYRVRIRDMWKLSMNHIYHSMIGVCNVIFTVAIILLSIKFWNEVGIFLKLLMIFGCLLFTVFHPLLIFLRSAKQVEEVPGEMILRVNESGLCITDDSKVDNVPWNRVRGTMIERGMVILVIKGGRGYILTDKVLGSQKEAFLNFVEAKVKKNKA